MNRYIIEYFDGEYDHQLLIEADGGRLVYKIDNHTIGIGETKLIMDVPYPDRDFEIRGITKIETFPSDSDLFTGNY